MPLKPKLLTWPERILLIATAVYTSDRVAPDYGGINFLFYVLVYALLIILYINARDNSKPPDGF